MRASAFPTGTGVGAVEQPSQGQTAVTEVPGRDLGPRVVAPSHDYAGTLAVQVGRAGEETINAIAVIISPIRDDAAGRLEVGRGPYGSGLTVEHGQKLRTAEYTTYGVAKIRVCVSDHLTGSAA